MSAVDHSCRTAAQFQTAVKFLDNGDLLGAAHHLGRARESAYRDQQNLCMRLAGRAVVRLGNCDMRGARQAIAEALADLELNT